MTVVMAVDERYAANGRLLRAEAAASETQHEKLRQTMQRQIKARIKAVCGDEFATRLKHKSNN